MLTPALQASSLPHIQDAGRAAPLGKRDKLPRATANALQRSRCGEISSFGGQTILK